MRVTVFVCSLLVAMSASGQEATPVDPNAPVQLQFGQPSDAMPAPPSSTSSEPAAATAAPTTTAPTTTAPTPVATTAPTPVAPAPVAQVWDDTPSHEYARHSLYFEALGPGLLYSLSFDYRFVESAAFRIGVGYFEFGFLGPSHDFVTVPLTLSYLTGASDHFFEAGMGGTLVFETRSTDVTVSDTEVTGFAVVLLGYRYQRASGGFMLRVGINGFLLLLSDDDGQPLAFPWPYLALGLTF